MTSQQYYISRKPAEEFLTTFAKALKEPESHPLLFHVYGIGGIGKSTLLDTLEETHSHQAHIVKFDFTGKTLSNETPLKVMNKLYEQIPQPGILKQDLFKSDPFIRLCEQYQGTLEELTTTPIEGKKTVEKDQRDLVKDLGSAAVYGLGAFFLAPVEPVSAISLGVSAIAETTKGTVSGVGAIKDNLLLKHPATKQNKKLQELMLEPIPELTKAFVEGLIQNQNARLVRLPNSPKKPIILVLDHYEKAASDLNSWLVEYLLKQSGLQSQPIRIVVAGRYSLRKQASRERDLIFERQLEKFDNKQTEEYLKKISITDTKQIRQIYQATDGFPFHLDLIRQQKEEGRDINCSRDNKELVDRLLEGLTSNQKQVMHLAAYCRWFDEALIQKLVTANGIDKDEKINWFEWLIERELVVEENQFRLHDVVRDILRRSHFKANQEKFRDNHGLIAKYFEKLADGEVHPGNPEPEKYENSQWRQYTAESLYHALFERTKAQRLLLTHLFAGVYLKKMDVVVVAYVAVAAEGEFENNELLPPDTRKFLEDIKLALKFGRLLSRDPNNYEIKNDSSLKSQIEASVKTCLSQVDFLEGLGKYAGILYKTLRSRSSQQVDLLQQAKAKAEQIATDSYPEFSSNLFFNVGYRLGILEQNEEALNSFDKALAIKDDFAEAWDNRGVSLLNLERNEEALNSFDKALAIKDDFAEAWNHRSGALLKLERSEEALASCDKVLAIKDDFAEAWNKRGIALEKLEQNEEALVSYDQALAIKNDFADVWGNRGDTLNTLHRYEEAIISFDKGLKIQPDKPNILNSKGLTLSLLCRYDEALANLEKALKIQPKKPVLWANKGIILARAGCYQEALDNCEKALVLEMQDEGGYYGKACCYVLQGDVDLALKNLQQAININPRRCRREAKTNPDFDSIRNDSRFQALLQG
ncbi:TPR repeat-containing protein [Cylindrospermum stagnale PCC 7417]|uniref:TPR repeat-containing protein n=1 Tax=Cylindrospermum stagnale PCC 7417 TaxID=56107 RepID=K9WXC9_9NOST|nr:tetratricopeptide repeat protein [Cylindrospermum stagnale]AFZ24456.1 TPR repeat-containing protein [Cylindrospermum stagnale PCC 7417]